MNEIYPYAVLGLSSESVTDQEVRNAYLERVRLFPPESHPERFQLIHSAYDAIQTEQKRLLRRYEQPVPNWSDLGDMFPPSESTPLVPLASVTGALCEERIAQLFGEESS